MGRRDNNYYHRYLKNWGLLFLIFFIFSCREKKDDQKKVLISGYLKNYTNDFLLMEELTPTDLIFKDSLIVDDRGYFEYDFLPTQPGFFRLGFSSTDFVTLVLKPGESVLFNADADHIYKDYKIEGSVCSELYKDINQQIHDGREKADSLRDLYRTHMYRKDFVSIREELKKEYEQIREEKRNYLKSFIQKNSYSLASILALYQYFENQVLLDEEKDLNYYVMVSNHLSELYPSNKHVIDLKKRVNDRLRVQQENNTELQSLEPGSYAPEIVLPDPEGKNIALSSLRGKIVLIDFWAAWCPPCRKQNKKMKYLYDKYNNSGFEIYAVSLDRTHQKWVEAIQDDDMKWIHVSDLRFMNSPVVDFYQIAEIPYEILIDRQGKIIAKDISMDEIENLIAEHL
ncbi:MAG: redoxin domain-containing protein [Bacteroidota bacterium]